MRLMIILICSFCACSVFAQNPFYEKLNAGPHAVGFKLIKIQDSNRIYADGPRIIPVSYWYPATKASNIPLTFEHYVLANAGLPLQEASDKKASLIEAYLDKNSRYGASKTDLSAILNRAVLASLDAPANQMDFPLVITLQGGGRPAYTQFILNEWLASQGYRVAAIPDLRSAANRQATTAKSNALALSQDLKLVIEKLKFNNSVAVIAFSKAGEAVLHRQMQEAAFDAMIFMDGQPGDDIAQELGLELKKDQTPTLAFFSNHQGRMDLQTAQKDSSAFEMLGGNLLKIRLMQANHGDLTATAVLGDIAANFSRWPAFGNSRLSYESLCRFTLFFLDHYLKDKPGESRVESLMKTLPEEFISMHRIVRKQ